MASDSEINVRVTATTAELKSNLNSAKADVKDFGDEVNNLAQRVAAVKPDAFKALAEEFNAGKIDLDEFRDGLIAVSATQSAAAKEAVNLAEKTAVSSGAMREFVVVGRELASGNLTRLPGSLSILATRLGGIPPQAILATAAVAAFGYAIYEVVAGSEKLESDLDKIQNAFTAVGRGDLFDRREITQYIDDLRQIPGVTEDAATAIVNAFARSRNGGEQLVQLVGDVKPFADLIGKDVPQAARILAESFNDPIKAIQLLKNEGVELTASQQQQITQMMAVNNYAGAQAVLLEGINTAMAHVVDTSTSLDRFLHNLGNSLHGVNEQATGARAAIDGFVNGLLHVPNFSERNLPGSQWSGSSGSVSATDKAKQNKDDNEAVSVTNQMFERGNSLLREQELHRDNIKKIQEGINAAERQGDASAVQRGQADLEAENKRHQQATSRGDKGENTFALAEARGEAEAADARIKTEQDLVNEKLRLGEISSTDAVKQLKELAAQEHEINLKRIADMRAVYAKQANRAGVATSDSDTEKENARYEDQSNKIIAQGAEAKKKADEAEIEGDKRVADAKAQTALAAMQDKVKLGQASAEQELALELQTLNDKHAAEDASFQALAAMYSKDSAAYIKALKDKEVADQKWQRDVGKINTDAALKSQQDWQKSLAPISRAFDTSIQGMVLGTQNLHQAVGRIGQSIVGEFVSNAEKMVEKWLISEVTKTAATDVGAAARQAAESAGTNASVANNIKDTEKQQSTDAVGVYSSVFNYLAPELGPFAAIPAALASASVLALSLPSAAGGMIVPNDTLAMVHENEMVLPARYTSGLTSMIDRANAGGGGSGHTFNNTFQISGVQPKDIPNMIDSHIQKQARNGAYGGMRTTR